MADKRPLRSTTSVTSSPLTSTCLLYTSHHLGLTCDPICGLVQIPCIERNAVAAMRAINAVRIANFLTATRKISFDTVVKTMYETGRDLSGRYRETAEGGLAKNYRRS